MNKRRQSPVQLLPRFRKRMHRDRIIPTHIDPNLWEISEENLWAGHSGNGDYDGYDDRVVFRSVTYLDGIDMYVNGQPFEVKEIAFETDNRNLFTPRDSHIAHYWWGWNPGIDDKSSEIYSLNNQYPCWIDKKSLNEVYPLLPRDQYTVMLNGVEKSIFRVILKGSFTHPPPKTVPYNYDPFRESKLLPRDLENIVTHLQGDPFPPKEENLSWDTLGTSYERGAGYGDWWTNPLWLVNFTVFGKYTTFDNILKARSIYRSIMSPIDNPTHFEPDVYAKMKQIDSLVNRKMRNSFVTYSGTYLTQFLIQFQHKRKEPTGPFIQFVFDEWKHHPQYLRRFASVVNLEKYPLLIERINEILDQCNWKYASFTDGDYCRIANDFPPIEW